MLRDGFAQRSCDPADAPPLPTSPRAKPVPAPLPICFWPPPLARARHNWRALFRHGHGEYESPPIDRLVIPAVDSLRGERCPLLFSGGRWDCLPESVATVSSRPGQSAWHWLCELAPTGGPCCGYRACRSRPRKPLFWHRLTAAGDEAMAFHVPSHKAGWLKYDTAHPFLPLTPRRRLQPRRSPNSDNHDVPLPRGRRPSCGSCPNPPRPSANVNLPVWRADVRWHAVVQR